MIDIQRLLILCRDWPGESVAVKSDELVALCNELAAAREVVANVRAYCHSGLPAPAELHAALLEHDDVLAAKGSSDE